MQRALRRLAAAAWLTAGLAACGQRGPLTLPSDARPIERVEVPPAAPNADDASDNDDERENER